MAAIPRIGVHDFRRPDGSRRQVGGLVFLLEVLQSLPKFCDAPLFCSDGRLHLVVLFPESGDLSLSILSDLLDFLVFGRKEHVGVACLKLPHLNGLLVHLDGIAKEEGLDV